MISLFHFERELQRFHWLASVPGFLLICPSLRDSEDSVFASGYTDT